MAEPYNLVTRTVALCHKEICNKPDDDHSESASFSGASSASFSSSASNLSDDETSSPPGYPSEPFPASSSKLRLDAGPLYELSSLLDQLPIRKGLSNYYQGKSQSFTSISDATSVQDLAKKIPHSKRMKTCKTYSTGLDMNQRSNILPRPCNKVIAKRPSNGSFARVMSRTSNTSHSYISAKQSAQQNRRGVQMLTDLTK